MRLAEMNLLIGRCFNRKNKCDNRILLIAYKYASEAPDVDRKSVGDPDNNLRGAIEPRLYIRERLKIKKC